jgi:hypothetical protein
VEGVLSLFSVQKKANLAQERPQQGLEEVQASKRAMVLAEKLAPLAVAGQPGERLDL